MSTKQSIIFTFMVIFLATTVFAIGAFFHYSSELKQKDSQIEMLTLERTDLKRLLEGSEAENRVGLRSLVDHAEKGLKALLARAVVEARQEQGDQTSGAEEVRFKYEAKGPELQPKWNDAGTKWKTLYEEWLKLNGDIDGAYKRLVQQQAESNTKSAEAQAELDKQLQDETLAMRKYTDTRKKEVEDINNTRRELESVQDRTTEVSRQTRRAIDIAPQGRVVYADEKAGVIALDIGAGTGVKYGMEFDLYSKSHANLVKKGRVRIVEVKPSSSLGKIIPSELVVKQDKITGWVPPDPTMRYSVFSTSGQDESNVQELEVPKTRRDRVDAYEQERLEREIGAEKAEELRRKAAEPDAPPSEIGSGFVAILEGDWVHNAEFIPITTDRVFEKKSTEEVIAMRDINISPLTFFFTDSIRPYRAEFLKRLAERNGCKVATEMSNDVNLIVATAGNTRADLLEQKLSSTKGKDEVAGEIKNLRKTLDSLLAGQKVGAGVISEDQIEGFFAQRARKLELLRGNAIQPGLSTFFVAGETLQRSVEHTRRYIQDHGGVVKSRMNDNVDYVVVGAGLDAAFYEEVKKLGLKILREDELDWFFGKAKTR